MVTSTLTARLLATSGASSMAVDRNSSFSTASACRAVSMRPTNAAWAPGLQTSPAVAGPVTTGAAYQSVLKSDSMAGIAAG
jgi:hypothetical protein